MTYTSGEALLRRAVRDHRVAGRAPAAFPGLQTSVTTSWTTPWTTSGSVTWARTAAVAGLAGALCFPTAASAGTLAGTLAGAAPEPAPVDPEGNLAPGRSETSGARPPAAPPRQPPPAPSPPADQPPPGPNHDERTRRASESAPPASEGRPAPPQSEAERASEPSPRRVAPPSPAPERAPAPAPEQPPQRPQQQPPPATAPSGQGTARERAEQAAARPVTPERIERWAVTISNNMTQPAATAVVALPEIAPSPTMGWSYEIKRGDSLWHISEHVWADAPSNRDLDRTWRLIYQWNDDVLGPDPDLIHPGQVVQIPADDGTEAQ